MSVPTFRVLAAALVLLTVPLAVGHESEGLTAADATLTITPDNDPEQDGHQGEVIFLNRTHNEWFAWRIDTQEPHLVLDLHLHGDFGVERPQQLVPTLTLDANSPGCEGTSPRGLCDFPLFHPYPNQRVWEADGKARVYSVNGTADDFTLLLRIPGPLNGTLVLRRDMEPPQFEIEPTANLTHFSFLRTTRTDELVLADTQVRRVGTTEWVVNPTPEFHHTQHFPVQGLAADTDYEVRTLFTDWSGNRATSDTTIVHTLAAPARTVPTITPLLPAPNATLTPGAPTNLSVRFETLGAPIDADGSGIVLFLDKKAITSGLVIELDSANRTSGTITYTAAALGPGLHTVRFEVTNEEGGVGAADWTFVIDAPASTPESKDTPLPFAIGLVALALAATRRRRTTD